MRVENNKGKRPTTLSGRARLPNQQLVADVEPVLLIPACITVVLQRVSPSLFALYRRGISH